MSKTYLRVALFAGLVVVPLAVMAAVLLADASRDPWAALLPLALPYLWGLVPGIVLVAYLVASGRASTATAPGTNLWVWATVSAVAVPAAIILPTILGDDFRVVVVMLGAGFLAPLMPFVILQILRESPDQ